MVIAHASLSVSDYPKSKDFYTKALKPLGYTQNMEYGEAAGFNDGKKDFRIPVPRRNGRYGRASGNVNESLPGGA